MKIKILWSALFFLVLSVASNLVYAQVPGPGNSYNSSFTVQNLEDVSVHCVFSIYKDQDTPIYTSPQFNISPNGSYFVYIGNLSIPNGQYSVVIACDGRVAAVSNFGSSSGNAASYVGFDASSTSSALYFPVLMKNYYGYYSNIVVQNAGSITDNVVLEIYRSGASDPVLSIQSTNPITPNTSFNFDLRIVSGLADGLYFGRIVSQKGSPVAAISNWWNNGGQQGSYNAFNQGALAWYVPLLMENYYGWNTSLTVQNIGSMPTIITVTYSNGIVLTRTIPANSGTLFYTPNDLPGFGPWLVSARVESQNQPIVAIINEAGPNNRAASYKGFQSGSLKVVAPIVLKSYYGFTSSVTCQNIGSSITNIKITYSNGFYETKNGVSPGSSVLFYQGNSVGLPIPFNGSAIVESLNEQPIVCVISQDKIGDLSQADWALVYEGLPK